MFLTRSWRCGLAFWLVLLTTTYLNAEILINEIFYHAPNDLDDLEYVELANTGSEIVDVSGWSLAGEVRFSFGDGASIPANGYIVVSKDGELLREFYGVEAVGEYQKSLSNSGGRLKLLNSKDVVVDSVHYADRAPWPLAADGYSASLERVSLTAPSDPANWAPSKLSDDYDSKPSGTPGRKNSVKADALGPAVSVVAFDDSGRISPGEELEVVVKFANANSVVDASLHYQHVAPGEPGDESKVQLKRRGSEFVGLISTGNESNRLLRFHVTATNQDGGITRHPHQNAVRPTFTVYVNDEVETDKLAVANFFFANKTEAESGERYRESQREPVRRDRFRGFRGGPPRGFERGGPERGDFERGEPERGDPERRRFDRRDFDRRGGFDRRGFGGPRGRFGGFPSRPLRPQGVGAFIYKSSYICFR